MITADNVENIVRDTKSPSDLADNTSDSTQADPVFLSCILPSGNASQFPKLDAELSRRGVRYGVIHLPTGGRVYRIPQDQLHLLPSDEDGPYLGDVDSGHSLYIDSDPDLLIGYATDWRGQ